MLAGTLPLTPTFPDKLFAMAGMALLERDPRGHLVESSSDRDFEVSLATFLVYA